MTRQRASPSPSISLFFSFPLSLSLSSSRSQRTFISSLSLDNNPATIETSFRIKIPRGIIHAGLFFARHDLFFSFDERSLLWEYFEILDSRETTRSYELNEQ